MVRYINMIPPVIRTTKTGKTEVFAVVQPLIKGRNYARERRERKQRDAKSELHEDSGGRSGAQQREPTHAKSRRSSGEAEVGTGDQEDHPAE